MALSFLICSPTLSDFSHRSITFLFTIFSHILFDHFVSVVAKFLLNQEKGHLFTSYNQPAGNTFFVLL